MTVENTQNKMPPLQMGTTNEYPFTFAVLLQDPTEEEALEAIKASVLQADGTEVELVYNTDYTVTLNTDRIGGTLTVNDIRTSSDYITIYRQYEQTQEVDYKDFNSAPAETFEQCFDKLTMLSQQQQEEINRSLKLNVSSTIIDPSLPEPIANNTLIWDSVGSSLKNYDIIGENNQFKAEVNAAIIAGQADIQAQLDEFENVINSEIEDVREAAEKINELEQAVDDAQTAANSAEASADEAQILANEAQASANEARQLVQNAQTTLNTRADIDLSNLSANGEKHFLNKAQITNCLLEVPQNIKLELNNGTLTLKAGSVVTVPNGFEADGTTPKFDEMTIESDLAVIGANQQTFVFYSPMRTDDIHYDYLSSANICSGSTDSLAGVNPHIWYDTTNNLIKVFTNSSTTPARNISFPFCIATAVNNEFTSIDQVFNGMGYIGSTVWVDKGVKGLIPNGRNEDGSLNNVEFTIPSVLVSTQTGGNRDFVGIGRNSATSYYVYRGASANYKYDKESNVNIDVPNNAQWNILPIGSTTGDITSFNPKQPFRAVDYNEAVVKSSLKECQVVIETYVNGTSWYRIWSDGYCEQWGQVYHDGENVIVTVSLLKNFKDVNYQVLATNNTSTKQWATTVDLQITDKTINSFGVVANIVARLATNNVNWRAYGYIW